MKSPIVDERGFTLHEFAWARREHAFLCRAEGETFAKLGLRLGVCDTRAHALHASFGRSLGRALRRVRFTATERNDHE